MANLTHFFAENLWLCLGFLVVLNVYIFFELQHSKHKRFMLSTQDAVKLVNREKGVFLDIRGEKAYREGHILEAQNTTLENLQSSTKFLRRHQQNPVVVYANGNEGCVGALELLKKEGFERVFILKDGLIQWRKDNYPIETKAPAISSESVKANTKNTRKPRNKPEVKS